MVTGSFFASATETPGNLNASSPNRFLGALGKNETSSDEVADSSSAGSSSSASGASSVVEPELTGSVTIGSVEVVVADSSTGASSGDSLSSFLSFPGNKSTIADAPLSAVSTTFFAKALPVTFMESANFGLSSNCSI